MKNTHIILTEENGKLLFHFPRAVECLNDASEIEFDKLATLVAFSDEFKNVECEKEDTQVIILKKRGVTTLHFKNDVLFYGISENELYNKVIGRHMNITAFSGEF